MGFSTETRPKKKCEMHLPGRYIDFRTLFPPCSNRKSQVGFPIRFLADTAPWQRKGGAPKCVQEGGVVWKSDKCVQGGGVNCGMWIVAEVNFGSSFFLSWSLYVFFLLFSFFFFCPRGTLKFLREKHRLFQQLINSWNWCLHLLKKKRVQLRRILQRASLTQSINQSRQSINSSQHSTNWMELREAQVVSSTTPSSLSSS